MATSTTSMSKLPGFGPFTSRRTLGDPNDRSVSHTGGGTGSIKVFAGLMWPFPHPRLRVGGGAGISQWAPSEGQTAWRGVSTSARITGATGHGKHRSRRSGQAGILPSRWEAFAV